MVESISYKSNITSLTKERCHFQNIPAANFKSFKYAAKSLENILQLEEVSS
jgi:hypothetical protein